MTVGMFRGSESITGPQLPVAPAAERWAAPPLGRVPDQSAQPETAIARDVTPLAVVYAAFAALLGFSLLESLMYALIQGGIARRRSGNEPSKQTASGQHAASGERSSRAAAPIDYEAKCQQLFQTVSALWAKAETAVFDLDEALPLRSLLFKELRHISRRLALDSDFRLGVAGALTVNHDKPYWRLLSQRLNQSARDLNRIATVAEAASAGFGDRNSEPRIPKSRDEACFILGANREADADTLQRLVRALRQCWHPDLAQTDQDRTYREARIKQINAAHDLITGKRAEG